MKPAPKLGNEAELAEDFQSRASDLVKKILTVGVGTYFLTEESLKGLISEFKLPKELISGILESGTKAKRDFLNRFSKDITEKVMEKWDLADLVREFARDHKINIQLQIDFTPKAKSEKSAK